VLHTHFASVHQAAKLVAALLRVAGVTAGLAESTAGYKPGGKKAKKQKSGDGDNSAKSVCNGVGMGAGHVGHADYCYKGIVVCVSVGHNHEPCKNG